jgi:kumamolisin
MAQIPKGYKPVQGTERAPVPGAKKLGPAEPNEQLTVSIRVRRRPDAPPLPSANDWKSVPQARFSREEFAARFGASEDDLQRVEEFARSKKLQVVEANIARRTVVVSGTVQQMNSAFGVELAKYDSPRGTYRGREGPVHLPVDLVDIVEGVFGLDNRRMAQRFGGSPGPSSVTPRQVGALYNFPQSVSAASQTIGLLEFGSGFDVSDIEMYFGNEGLITPSLVAVSVDGTSNSPDGGAEVTLDIEVSGSIAQGANIAVYFAPFTEQGWVDIVTTAIYGTGLPAGWAAPSAISISWGWAELESTGNLSWTVSAVNAVDDAFQEAAMLGITIFAATGDNGTDCGIGDGKAHVTFPSSSPWVTACGGTSIQNLSGSSFTEATWNDDGVTGGGISDIFPLPEWQIGAGVPGSINDGHFGRGTPDIAGQADGYNIFLEGSWLGPVVGTSEVSPLYAGLTALMNAAMADTVGYLNPFLYQLGILSRQGATSGIFRDIADGGSNADSGAPGYHSVPGWDACTGWGSVHGAALLNAIETYLFMMILPAIQ